MRRGLVAALIALPLAAAPAARAEGSEAPPFSSAHDDGWCDTDTYVILTSVPGGGECEADAEATEAGMLSTDLTVETGPLPVSEAYADAMASVSKYVWIQDVSIISYTVTFRVSGSHVTITDGSPLPGGGYGDASFNGNAYVLGEEAGSGFYVPLASSPDDVLEDGTYTRRLLLASEDGQPMTGPVELTFDIWSYLSLDGPSTTGSLGATVEILSVESRIIE